MKFKPITASLVLFVILSAIVTAFAWYLTGTLDASEWNDKASVAYVAFELIAFVLGLSFGSSFADEISR